MKKTGYIILFMMLMVCNLDNVVLAGALEKFGSERRYDAPTIQQSNPREDAINRAVRGIKNADEDHRQSLIDEYRRRINNAHEKGNYDEAAFYTEILRRSEARQ
jgi:hypothetical protein